MNQTELIALFRQKKMEGYQEVFFDKEYASPTKRWLTGPFSQTFRRNLKALGLDKWLKESNDCDNFALLAMALARINHAMTFPDSGRELSFGMFGYRTDMKVNHELNVVKVENDELVHWEPQRQSIVQLTPSEVSECLNIII